MAIINLKSVQLLVGVSIPGISTQTLTMQMCKALQFDEATHLIYVDTGRGEHFVPVTSCGRLDPVSDKYKPKTIVVPVAAPVEPPGPDVVKFTKDANGKIVESRR